ncbi:MAG: carbohydrate ABC transporter permease [Treponema sp.]|jgi:multiple sugar transport system permease protein|nr:carbohydrate ABC transporter permease [Treponema sp.]
MTVTGGIAMKKLPSIKRRNRIMIVLRYVILSSFAITMVVPLVWMFTVSLKANETIFVIPPDIVPREFNWSNYSIALKQMDFLRSFINTLLITVTCVIGQSLSCTLVAYGISRIKFPGRKIWFYAIIASMMLPGMIGTIPVFMFFSSLGWVNTFLPLIVPAFLGSPFYTFLLRQTFMGISRSFDEAARIDGAGHLTILFRILVPMIKPALMVIVIMATQASWNDYLNPLLYLHKKELWTLSIAIKAFTGQYSTSWNLFMAADFVYLLPILIVFIVLQRYFMSGLGSLNSTALK